MTLSHKTTRVDAYEMMLNLLAIGACVVVDGIRCGCGMKM